MSVYVTSFINVCKMSAISYTVPAFLAYRVATTHLSFLLHV